MGYSVRDNDFLNEKLFKSIEDEYDRLGMPVSAYHDRYGRLRVRYAGIKMPFYFDKLVMADGGTIVQAELHSVGGFKNMTLLDKGSLREVVTSSVDMFVELFLTSDELEGLAYVRPEHRGLIPVFETPVTQKKQAAILDTRFWAPPFNAPMQRADTSLDSWPGSDQLDETSLLPHESSMPQPVSFGEEMASGMMKAYKPRKVVALMQHLTPAQKRSRALYLRKTKARRKRYQQRYHRTHLAQLMQRLRQRLASHRQLPRHKPDFTYHYK